MTISTSAPATSAQFAVPVTRASQPLERARLLEVERLALGEVLLRRDVEQHDVAELLGDARGSRARRRCCPRRSDQSSSLGHVAAILRRMRSPVQRMCWMMAAPNSEHFTSCRAFHQPREVVGHGLRADRAVHALDDRSAASLQPMCRSIISPREDHRARVHLVEVGVLRRGAVRGLEDRVAGLVVDVAAGRDADAADLRRQRVGQVVAVQVQRGDDVEVLRRASAPAAA